MPGRTGRQASLYAQAIRAAASGIGIALVIAVVGVAQADDLPDVSARAPWTLYDRNDAAGSEYVVYVRKPPGSEFSAYRIEALLDSPIEEVAKVAAQNLADPDYRPKNTIKTILKNDPDALLVHSHIEIHAPFVADRDVISRVTQSYDPATKNYLLRWSATNEGPPPKQGVIRLERSDGYWSFTPTDDNKTHAVYVSHTEIAGAIPAWVVNSIMSETMVDGMEGLRRSLVVNMDATP